MENDKFTYSIPKRLFYHPRKGDFCFMLREDGIPDMEITYQVAQVAVNSFEEYILRLDRIVPSYLEGAHKQLFHSPQVERLVFAFAAIKEK